MVKCPKCGKEAGPPLKQWTVKLRRQKAGPTGTGKVGDPNKPIEATIQQYRCPHCKKAFRKGVPKEA